MQGNRESGGPSVPIALIDQGRNRRDVKDDDGQHTGSSATEIAKPPRLCSASQQGRGKSGARVQIAPSTLGN